MLMAAVVVAGVSCSSQKQSASVVETTTSTVKTGQAAYLPQAIAYKTSAPVADYVPVTVNADRTEIVAYPAPGDITSNSRPVPLDDGWLLDRRGVSSKTAFTSYTYAEYAALQSAPSREQLLRSIQPGVTVTDIISLPMKAGAATAESANRAIRSGDYTVVYSAR